MDEDYRLRLKFWGVRGSTPTPQIENLSYGGNTPCLEIRGSGGQLLVFDGGTGLRNLGMALKEEFQDRPIQAHFFLTHFHWDHIQGIPFFAPLYERPNRVTFHTGHPTANLQEMLEGQMRSPYFPVDFTFMSAEKRFRRIETAETYGDVTVRPFPLNHPQGAYGYRIECAGKSIVYASDLEHGHPELDSVLRRSAQGADILIFDAQYTPEEYEDHKGWGHSTWLEATRVAEEVGVGQLFLFHHDPSHDDRMFYEIVQAARVNFENTHGAKEGTFFLL